MLSRLLSTLSPNGELARNTYMVTGWLGIRVAVQTVWVIALARTLGPAGYGQLAGIAGLAATIGTMTGLGLGLVMLQDVSRRLELFSSSWKRAWVISLASGITLCVPFVLVSSLIFNDMPVIAVLAMIAITELVAFPLVVVASLAFQVNGRMGWGGAIYALIPLGNLIALACYLMFTPEKGLSSYLVFHALLAVLTAIVAVCFVQTVLAPATAPFSLNQRDVREGAGFSLMRLADTAFVSLDKTLILMIAGSQVAGVYTAGYRLISVFTLPLISLSMSVLPRLFRTNSGRKEHTASLVRSLTVAVTGYGFLAAIGIWLVSDFLPLLLGEQFQSAANAARWLMPLPLIHGLYLLAANLLVTSHRRTLRIALQALGLAVLVVTAVIFVPSLGLMGAVLMLLVTQATLAIAMWVSVKSIRHT